MSSGRASTSVSSKKAVTAAAPNSRNNTRFTSSTKPTAQVIRRTNQKPLQNHAEKPKPKQHGETGKPESASELKKTQPVVWALNAAVNIYEAFFALLEAIIVPIVVFLTGVAKTLAWLFTSNSGRKVLAALFFGPFLLVLFFYAGPIALSVVDSVYKHDVSPVVIGVAHIFNTDIAPPLNYLLLYYNTVALVPRALLLGTITDVYYCGEWREILFDVVRTLFAATNAALDWIQSPISSRLETYYVWKNAASILITIFQSLQCICESLDFISSFFTDILRSDNLYFALDAVVNIPVATFRSTLRLLVPGYPPLDFDDSFNEGCAFFQFSGAWLDEILLRAVRIFFVIYLDNSATETFGVGDFVGTLLCTPVRLGELLFYAFVNAIYVLAGRTTRHANSIDTVAEQALTAGDKWDAIFLRNVTAFFFREAMQGLSDTGNGLAFRVQAFAPDYAGRMEPVFSDQSPGKKKRAIDHADTEGGALNPLCFVHDPNNLDIGDVITQAGLVAGSVGKSAVSLSWIAAMAFFDQRYAEQDPRTAALETIFVKSEIYENLGALGLHAQCTVGAIFYVLNDALEAEDLATGSDAASLFDLRDCGFAIGTLAEQFVFLVELLFRILDAFIVLVIDGNRTSPDDYLGTDIPGDIPAGTAGLDAFLDYTIENITREIGYTLIAISRLFYCLPSDLRTLAAIFAGVIDSVGQALVEFAPLVGALVQAVIKLALDFIGLVASVLGGSSGAPNNINDIPIGGNPSATPIPATLPDTPPSAAQLFVQFFEDLFDVLEIVLEIFLDIVRYIIDFALLGGFSPAPDHTVTECLLDLPYCVCTLVPIIPNGACDVLHSTSYSYPHVALPKSPGFNDPFSRSAMPGLLSTMAKRATTLATLPLEMGIPGDGYTTVAESNDDGGIYTQEGEHEMPQRRYRNIHVEAEFFDKLDTETEALAPRDEETEKDDSRSHRISEEDSSDGVRDGVAKPSNDTALNLFHGIIKRAVSDNDTANDPRVNHELGSDTNAYKSETRESSSGIFGMEQEIIARERIQLEHSNSMEQSPLLSLRDGADRFFSGLGMRAFATETTQEWMMLRGFGAGTSFPHVFASSPFEADRSTESRKRSASASSSRRSHETQPSRPDGDIPRDEKELLSRYSQESLERAFRASRIISAQKTHGPRSKYTRYSPRSQDPDVAKVERIRSRSNIRDRILQTASTAFTLGNQLLIHAQHTPILPHIDKAWSASSEVYKRWFHAKKEGKIDHSADLHYRTAGKSSTFSQNALPNEAEGKDHEVNTNAQEKRFTKDSSHAPSSSSSPSPSSSPFHVIHRILGATNYDVLGDYELDRIDFAASFSSDSIKSGESRRRGMPEDSNSFVASDALPRLRLNLHTQLRFLELTRNFDYLFARSTGREGTLFRDHFSLAGEPRKAKAVAELMARHLNSDRERSGAAPNAKEDAFDPYLPDRRRSENGAREKRSPVDVTYPVANSTNATSGIEELLLTPTQFIIQNVQCSVVTNALSDVSDVIQGQFSLINGLSAIYGKVLNTVPNLAPPPPADPSNPFLATRRKRATPPPLPSPPTGSASGSYDFGDANANFVYMAFSGVSERALNAITSMTSSGANSSAPRPMTLGQRVQSAIDMIENTNTGANADTGTSGSAGNVEGHGILFYLLYPFTCPYPDAVSCTIGLGFAKGLLVAVVIELVIYFLGKALGMPFSIPFAILKPTGLIGIAVFAFLFLFFAYGYSPGCFLSLTFLPALPNCLISELTSFFSSISVMCIPWPPSIIISPANYRAHLCPQYYSKRFVFANFFTDPVVGFPNFFYNAVFLLHWLFPGLLSYIRGIPVLGWLIANVIPFVSSAVNRYIGTSGSNALGGQIFYFFLTLLPNVLVFYLIYTLLARLFSLVGGFGLIFTFFGYLGSFFAFLTDGIAYSKLSAEASAELKKKAAEKKREREARYPRWAPNFYAAYNRRFRQNSHEKTE